MPRSQKEIRTQEFECSRLGDVADVHLTYLVLEELGVETLTGFDCDQCKECGVAQSFKNGMSWSFDWKKCVHPVQQKNHG